MSIWKRLYCVLGRIHKDSRELKGSSFVFEKSFENLLRKDGILPLQLNGYERHPNGANHYPDFEIYDKRSFLSVELKTSKYKLELNSIELFNIVKVLTKINKNIENAYIGIDDFKL